MVRIRQIGKGGLGKVDLYQHNDGRLFAVKQMLYAWDQIHFDRFKREIEIMSNLVHKNIIRVLNFDVHNGNPWYVMPFYRDGSLRDKLEDVKTKGFIYTIPAATGIIYHLANALHYAHAKGIVHRDLKPENILFEGQNPILADWGIGKFIHANSKVLTYGGLGTKAYCSPEQWNTGEADERSDIYSLGMIYRELISGYTHGKVDDVQVNRIINKMCMVSPHDRYHSMRQVMGAIEQLNIISKEKPMDEFWSKAAVVAVGVGLVVLLAQLFGSSK